MNRERTLSFTEASCEFDDLYALLATDRPETLGNIPARPSSQRHYRGRAHCHIARLGGDILGKKAGITMAITGCSWMVTPPHYHPSRNKGRYNHRRHDPAVLPPTEERKLARIAKNSPKKRVLEHRAHRRDSLRFDEDQRYNLLLAQSLAEVPPEEAFLPSKTQSALRAEIINLITDFLLTQTTSGQ